ncbi:MAG: hypothetical protein ACE5FU_09475, partial [Nitrospinota bacterium]
MSREKILIGASEKKKSIFYLLSGTFQLREKETATLFWLQKDENKASGELLNYYGLNYNGDLKSNLFIWFQLAQIWGRDSKGKIVGA